jgi:hypothetical protein
MIMVWEFMAKNAAVLEAPVVAMILGLVVIPQVPQ